MEIAVHQSFKQSARVAFCVWAVMACFPAAGYGQGEKITTTKEYYDTGELRAVTNFLGGEKQGPAKIYHKNGVLKEDLWYKKGQLDGAARLYNDQGQIEETREYYKDEIIQSANARPQDLEISEDKSVALPKDDDQALDKEAVEFLRPPPVDELRVRAVSRPEGSEDVKTHYDTGELQGTYCTVGGKKNGPARTYFKNGNIKEILNYKDDVLIGSARKYYEDGTLYQEANFKDGRLEGQARIYAPQGQLEEERSYEDNQVVASPQAGFAGAAEVTTIKDASGESVPAKPDEIAKEENDQEEKTDHGKNQEDIEELEWDFELGFETSNIVYQEPTLMRQNGTMYGLGGSATRRQKNTQILDIILESWVNMFKIDTRYSWGRVDYKGRLSNGTPANTNGIFDFMWESRLLAGHDFMEMQPVLLTLYSGLGYRYLFDDLARDPGGYERESQYVYCPIGIDVTKPFQNDWSIGGNLEFDGLLGGWQTSHLSNTDPGYNDLKNEQRNGYGARASLRFIKKGEKLSFVLEPFCRYWNIEESDLVAITYRGVATGLYGQEPENNSTEWGVKLLTRF